MGLASHDIKPFAAMQLSFLEKYVEAFFPGFLEENIFENESKYEFPYKHVTFEYLFFVHDMPQRFDLLDKAEKEKMSAIDFYNYVINFALCHNDENKRKIFRIAKRCYTQYYIKNNY